MTTVRFREVRVIFRMSGPTPAALDDAEAEIKRKIQRAINTHATELRHGVEIDAPLLVGGNSKDHDYIVDLIGVAPWEASE